MFLWKNSKPNDVHGVDYVKGLEDGRLCNRKHEFMTIHCRPVLFMEKSFGAKNYLDYDCLSDREKLELGEPIFFGSSLHKSFSYKRRESVEFQNCKCSS